MYTEGDDDEDDAGTTSTNLGHWAEKLIGRARARAGIYERARV